MAFIFRSALTFEKTISRLCLSKTIKNEVMPSVIVVVVHTESILHQEGPGNKRYTKKDIAITIAADVIEGRNAFFK